MKKIFILAMCMSMLQGCSNNAEKLLPSKEYYVDVVGELSSAQYYGRSNYENGSVKAAEFILGEIGKLGVKTVPEEVIVKAWEGKQKPELHALQPEFKSMITPSP